MLHPRYSSEEIIRRGKAIYDQQIRPYVETTHPGKFLAIDMETGAYEIDKDELAAIQRAKAKHPEAMLYLLRVEYPAAYRLGGKRPVARAR